MLSSLGALSCRNNPKEIRLLTFPESYGHHLSIGKGFYQQQGLTVAADYFQAFPKMMEALLAENGHIATAYFDALLPLVAEGRDVVAFACLAKRPGSVLAVAPAAIDKIKRIEDLAGATIGIPGLGSSSHLMLNAILRKRGVDPNRVRNASIGVGTSAIAAMGQGTVDAAMLTNLSLSTLRLMNPQLPLLADLRTPAGSLEFLDSTEYPSLCLVARKKWLKSNSNAAKKFAAAFLEANRWMSTHSPQDIRDALPRQARAENEQADIEAIQGMLPTLNTSGRLQAEAIQAAVKVSAASVDRVRESKADFSAAFTNQFL